MPQYDELLGQYNTPHRSAAALLADLLTRSVQPAPYDPSVIGDAAAAYSVEPPVPASTARKATDRDLQWSAAAKAAAERLAAGNKNKGVPPKPAAKKPLTAPLPVGGGDRVYPGEARRTTQFNAQLATANSVMTPEERSLADRIELGMGIPSSQAGRNAAMAILNHKARQAEAERSRHQFPSDQPVYSNPRVAKAIETYRELTRDLPSGMTPSRDSAGAFDGQGAVMQGSYNRSNVDPAQIAADKVARANDAQARMRAYVTRNLMQSGGQAAVDQFMASSPIGTADDQANAKASNALRANPNLPAQLQQENQLKLAEIQRQTEIEKARNQALGMVGNGIGQGQQAAPPGLLSQIISTLGNGQSQQKSPSAAGGLEEMQMRQMAHEMKQKMLADAYGQSGNAWSSLWTNAPSQYGGSSVGNWLGKYIFDPVMGRNIGNTEIGARAVNMMRDRPELGVNDIIQYLRSQHGDYGAQFEKDLADHLSGLR